MLLNFRIENFRSFHEETLFSMEASSQRDHPEILMNEKSAKRILPTAVVYGANASGKTNLFRAMSIFKQIIGAGDIKHTAFTSLLEQQKDMHELLPFTPFIFDDEKPVSLEIEFYNEKKYRYGFSYQTQFDPAATASIVEEHLFINEKQVFSRGAHDLQIFWKEIPGKKANANIEEILLDSLEPVDLFLCRGFKIGVSKTIADSVLEYIGNRLLTVLEIQNILETTAGEQESQSETIFYKSSLLDAINRLSLFGPQNISLSAVKSDEEGERFLEYISYYDTKNEKIPFGISSKVMESRGTLNFFNIIQAVDTVLEYGGALIVDELDSALHFNMMTSIIQLFHNREVNQKNAQLIFNTHNPVYMNKNLFRRDQIYIVEKNTGTHSSELFSLADFQTSGEGRVRNDQNYMINYLKGKYTEQPTVDLVDLFLETKETTDGEA